MVYAAIAPDADLGAISDKAKQLGYDTYHQKVLPVVLISYNKTSEELLDELGFKKRILVLRFTDYWGYSSKQFWEWVRVHEND